MQVVANKSFVGNGLSVRRGDVLDLKDKVANAWLEAGIVRKATDDDKAPATATTSKPATTAPSTPATGGSEPKSDEVVTDPKTTETKPPVAPNTKPNTTKASN